MIHSPYVHICTYVLSFDSFETTVHSSRHAKYATSRDILIWYQRTYGVRNSAWAHKSIIITSTSYTKPLIKHDKNQIVFLNPSVPQSLPTSFHTIPPPSSPASSPTTKRSTSLTPHLTLPTLAPFHTLPLLSALPLNPPPCQDLNSFLTFFFF